MKIMQFEDEAIADLWGDIESDIGRINCLKHTAV